MQTHGKAVTDGNTPKISKDFQITFVKYFLRVFIQQQF